MKNLKHFIVITVLFVCGFALAEPPKVTTTCKENSSSLKIKNKTEKVDWQFCIFKTEGSKNNDVVYHFHGKDNNELETNGWASASSYYQGVRETWANANFDAPIVVSMTFGDVWLLVEKNESPFSGLLEFASQLAIPTIDQELSQMNVKVEKRHLLGESMGGFNAAQLLLKSPQGYFTKTALICPAITTLSPFSNSVEVEKYIKETGANPDHVALLIKVSQYFIPTNAAWENTSPLILVNKMLNQDSGSLYVSCGDKDEYGFFKGAKLFFDAAVSNKVAATWVPLEGKGHCASNAKSIAEFFSK